MTLTNIGTEEISLFWQTEEPVETRLKVKQTADGGGKAELDIRNSDQKNTVHYVTLSNLVPNTDYEVEIINRSPELLTQYKNLNIQIATKAEVSNDVAERVYGKVVDKDGEAVANAVVMLTLNEKEYISTLTGKNGSYIFDINRLNPPADKAYLEIINVYSERFKPKKYLISSNSDQPVTDLNLDYSTIASKEEADAGVIPSEVPFEGIQSLVVNKVSAAGHNACIGDAMGGIRVQCSDKVHWLEEINPNNCPDPDTFTVGLVAHKDHTYFYNPDTLTFQIVNEKTNEVVAKGLKNGEKFQSNKLEFGETFLVKAFENGKECVDDGGYTKIIMDEKEEEYGEIEKSEVGEGVGSFPDVSNRCAKFGEHMARYIPRPTEDFQEISSMNMRWAQVIAPDHYEHTLYLVHYDTIQNASQAGVSLVLRIDNADTSEGVKYANNIIKLYERLVEEGTLPPNGLFIHAGHNEPNAAEYKDPMLEAQFIADTVRTLRNAGYLTQNKNDAGIKLLSPNLDMYNTDTVPGTHYRAGDYLDEMFKNTDFKTQAKYLYAVAGNTFLKDKRDISNDISGFYNNYLSKKSGLLPQKIFVTETGKMDGDVSWDKFESELYEIEALDYVVGVLLFNSMGFNEDPDFTYHQELWNNHQLVASLIDECEAVGDDIPQEGDQDPSPGEDSDDTIETDYMYSFKPGKNFIALPFKDESSSTADSFIKYLNENGGSIVSIDYFDGEKWNLYTVREDGSYYGNNFSLQPDRGYVINSLSKKQIPVTANLMNSEIEINLDDGWNLVGINGRDNEYSSKSILETLRNHEISAVGFSSWDNDTQKYDNLQYDEDSQEYFGECKSLNSLEGYFIKVDGEGGSISF